MIFDSQEEIYADLVEAGLDGGEHPDDDSEGDGEGEDDYAYDDTEPCQEPERDDAVLDSFYEDCYGEY